MSSQSLCRFLAVLACVSAGSVHAQAPSPVLATRGSQGDTTGTYTVPAPTRGISQDGRFVLIETAGVNLASGITDNNLTTDLYLLDRDTTTWTLVSRRRGTTSTTASGQSFGVDMTPDGRWILFRSSAADLVAGVTDTNGQPDVFLFDRLTATTTLVSRNGASATTTPNNSSFGRGISDDGRYVLWESDADNIAAIDANTRTDLFLFDRQDSSIRLVTRSAGSPTITANGDASSGRLSADGARVLYVTTATDVAAGIVDANGGGDAYLWSRNSGTTTLVSRSADSGSITANGAVSDLRLSANGDWAIYATAATNVLPVITDSNGTIDVYRWSVVTGTPALVSASATMPLATANQGATIGRISNDGNWVSMSSSSTNLVSGQVDTNNSTDVFVRDMGMGTTMLVSRADDLSTQTPSLNSTLIDATPDGRYFLFSSQANNIGGGVNDGNGIGEDVFVFDRVAQATRLVSHRADDPMATPTDNPASFSAALTGNGRWALFHSTSKQLVANVVDHNNNFDVFLKDLQDGPLTLLSRASQVAVNTPSGSMEFHGLSTDGRWVLFGSFAANVIGVTDAGTSKDLFLFDRDTRTTQLVSRRNGSATTTDNSAGNAVLSASGGRVAYASASTDVLAGTTDGNSTFDLFVYDRTTQTVQLASRAAGQTTVTANGESSPRAISADGRFVLFQSAATNLVPGVTDTNSQRDVFRHDTQTGTTILVSRAAGNPSQTANNRSDGHAISADGRWIAFSSVATNIASGFSDANGATDLFLFDADTGTVAVVSRAGTGQATGNGMSTFGAMSPDGAWIVFDTEANNLDISITDGNFASDVYRFDRDSGARTLVSHAAGDAFITGNLASRSPIVSDDGRFVAYSALASNLAAGITDNNGDFDVWLYDAASGSNALLSRSQSNPAQTGNGGSFATAISADGTFVALRSLAGNLAQDFDLNGAQDAFVHHVPSRTNKLLSRRALTTLRFPPFSGISQPAAMTPDAGTVVIASDSTELVEGINDGNGASDLFLAGDAAVVLADSFE